MPKSSTHSKNQTSTPNKHTFSRTAVILLLTASIWFLLDRITKIFFDSGQFSLGQNITDSFLGIFHLTLVHNTGAAFGMFANGTLVLGAISIAISIALLAMPFLLYAYTSRRPYKKSSSAKQSTASKNSSPLKQSTPFQLTTLQLFSVAIVAAGGIGNAVDRFVTGYVVDFICFDFINFPVFNIADIGVTCGILILVTNLLYLSFKPRT